MKKLLFIGFIILSACAQPLSNHESYLTKRGLSLPKANTLQHCRGYGCQYIDTVELNENEWKQIETPFHYKATSAKQEREQISTAIGYFEEIVGFKTGSDVDIKGTFKKTGTYQLDCVDESTNTTVYMLALKNRGLINFHEVEGPTARFPLIHSGRWPHQAALIKENETKNYFVIDSWFHDNGAKAEIVPLKQWKDGWKPNQDG